MWQKIKNLIKFVLLSSNATTAPTKSVNVEMYEVEKPALLYMPYGLQGNPATGIMGILINIEADEDNQMVLPTDMVNRDTLDAGEVALGIPALTARIKFKKDGSILITDKSGQQVKMDGNGKMIVTSPDVTITGGKLTIAGTVSPSGSGPLCAITVCPFTTAPHVGNVAQGT